jgi:threonine dehydrogenase-like Zn-dependent dehydrogenase
MKTKAIVFTSPWNAEFKDVELATEGLKPGQAVIRTEASILSAGTESAILAGTESSWAPLPYIPGYGAVGRIQETGPGLEHLTKGDLVFSHSKHASASLSDVMIVKVPEGLPARKAVFTRMAQVSITALRVADVALGDFVTVYGLGLVGNLAAQFFTLAGCEVIGIDLAEDRLSLAQQCGIRHVVDGRSDVNQEVFRITGGALCRAVVEATGVPSIAPKAAELVGPLGDLVLLGSPRGEYMTNLTDFLNRSHLWGNGCVTVKGAHEWRFPVEKGTSGHVRFSFQNNAECIFRLLADDRLKINPLTTMVADPADAQAVYAGVRAKKPECVGVVFDWSGYV